MEDYNIIIQHCPMKKSHTSRKLPEAKVLHRSCGDKGLLGVEQAVGQRVHTHMVVGDVYSHGLLAHSRLVGVTRRLGGDGVHVKI